MRDIENNTPMHVSMSSDGIDSIKILLAFGASLTKLNEYGETPLMTGAKFGHL
jgi:ankyrin repeat protein